MAENEDGAANGSDDGGQEDQEDKKTIEVGTDDWIPRSRFNEINNRNKPNEAELKTLRKAQEDADSATEKAKTASLKEQNKFKELYETEAQKTADLAVYKERFEGILTSTTEANEARVKALPAQFKAMVPDYEDPLKLATWLDANASTLTGGKTSPNLDGGAGSGNRTGKENKDVPSVEWITSQAGKLGVDPKLFGEQYGVKIS